jgi:hypothetical protein
VVDSMAEPSLDTPLTKPDPDANNSFSKTHRLPPTSSSKLDRKSSTPHGMATPPPQTPLTPSVSSTSVVAGPSGTSTPSSSTPGPSLSSKESKKALKGLLNAPPQIIDHLPVAREAALATFKQIDENWYQYGTLGRSRELGESMSCDCHYAPGKSIFCSFLLYISCMTIPYIELHLCALLIVVHRSHTCRIINISAQPLWSALGLHKPSHAS